MSVWLRWLVLGVVTSLAKAKPYEERNGCRNNTTEYVVENRCCSKCRPGTRLVQQCTTETDTVCEPCPAGMYSEGMNYYRNCFSCTKCQEEKGMEYSKQCSKVNDAVCACKTGWFCTMYDSNNVCNDCRKLKTCGPGKGAVSVGKVIKNIKCETCPPGTFSNDTSSQPCLQHTQCVSQGRSVSLQGNATTDTVCGPSLLIATNPVTIRSSSAKTRPSSTEASTQPTIMTTNQSRSVLTQAPDSISSVWMKVGLLVAVSLAVLLILVIAGFCIHHRKGAFKPPVQDVVDRSNSGHLFNPAEHHVLLADSGSDPSTSSSSDSHSQGTGVSQDCLQPEPAAVSSPVVNVNINFTCQMNPTSGSCTIPINHCVPPPEPEFPLSQEEELCMSCEQEDSKDAIQSVQESGMTKY